MNIFSSIFISDTLGFGNYLGLPVVVVEHLDRIFMKVFTYIPILKFIAGSSVKLPLYHHDMLVCILLLLVCLQCIVHRLSFFDYFSVPKHPNTSHLQPFAVPDDCPIPLDENSVSQYKLQRFQQMGFSKDESIVALSAASNNVDHAIGLLTSNQIGQEIAVLPVKIES